MLVDNNKIKQRERERDSYPIKNNTKKGYTMAFQGDGIDISARMKSHRGTVQKGMSQTIKTQIEVGVIDNKKIRRLTPKEAWRLMGIDDNDFEKASKVCTDNQLYKQAGNGIIVDVFYYILRGLIDES